ncbi:hypothetical protein PCK2_000114 [Pneumocystis canis]|nr:hypothetical protein PCK2_000114 [Pneumocystis canis]
MTPFDLLAISSNLPENTNIIDSLLTLSKQYLSVCGKERAFDNTEIIHVEGDVNPCHDLQIIHDELLIKDIEFVNKQLEGLKKMTNRGGQSLELKANKEKQLIVEKILYYLEVEKKEIRTGSWTNKEIQVINSLFLLTAKPVIYLINLDERDYLRQKNKWLPKITTWIKDNNPDDIIV